MKRHTIQTILAIAAVLGLTLPASAAVQSRAQSQPAQSTPPPPPPPAHSAPPPPPPAVHAAPPPAAVPRSGPAASNDGPGGHSRGGSSGARSGGQSGGGTTATTRGSGQSSGQHGGAVAVTRGETHGRAAGSPNLAGAATTNGTRARGDRTTIGTAVARQVPPHGGGGGGGYYPYYPIYVPAYFYPYAFGYAWDPFWWGGDPYWGGGGYPAYGGGGGDYQASGDADGYGALKIKVKPSDAQVYVDGYFAGLVDDFDGMFQKLTLPVGEHHIEVRDEGYAPLEFDIRIEYDQTVTYKAEMQKLPGPAAVGSPRN